LVALTNGVVSDGLAARKMLTNASYFAFTATPKNKTLEMFGDLISKMVQPHELLGGGKAWPERLPEPIVREPLADRTGG
jgi:hypothetical protein